MSALDVAKAEFRQTRHFNHKDTRKQSLGDLLRDALDLDERMSVTPAIRLIAHELRMLSTALSSDDGPNEEIIELVLYNVVQRLAVLAEIEDRMRSALDGRIRELESEVQELREVAEIRQGMVPS